MACQEFYTHTTYATELIYLEINEVRRLFTGIFITNCLLMKKNTIGKCFFVSFREQAGILEYVY